MSRLYMVLGGGISGQAACRLLLKDTAATVYLVDKNPAATSFTFVPALESGLRCLSEEAALANVALHKSLDFLVLSSGIPASHPLAIKVAAQGKELISEADLAFRHYQGSAIGITGTNGKSTVTKLVAHILNKANRPCLPCGNYGEALGDAVQRSDEFSYLSVELSSYQLASSKNLRFDAGIFVNFASDHESWHGNIKNYFLAKWRIVDGLNAASAFLVTSPTVLQAAKTYGAKIPSNLNLMLVSLEGDSPDSLDLPSQGKHELYYWSSTGLKDAQGHQQISWQSLSIIGGHNYYNTALAALAVSKVAGLPLQELDLSGFEPLPYRYQATPSKTGFLAINDSKATNVDAVLAALSSTVSPVVLMLGGISKNEPFAPIVTFSDRIQSLICFGASGASIAAEIGDKIKGVRLFPTLKDALDNAQCYLPTNQTVLLFSPGCASFDEFKNYNERGAYFSARISDL